MRLSVLTFNIEYGGELFFDKTLELIKKSNADIVCIQEAYGKLPMIADLLNYKYYDTKLQIMSKYPILMTDFKYDYIYLNTGFVAISNVHLPDEPEYYLCPDSRIRIDHLSPYVNDFKYIIKSIPSILTGDFNEPSHLDNLNVKYKNLCSEELLKIGFIDTFREKNKDTGNTYWAYRPCLDEKTMKEPIGRIDFIYASDACGVVDSIIIGEEDIDPYPSDHRTVLTTFDITPVLIDPVISPRKRHIKISENLMIDYYVPSDNYVISVGESYCIAEGYGCITVNLEEGIYSVRLSEHDTDKCLSEYLIYVNNLKTSISYEIVDGDLKIKWASAPENRWDWIGIVPKNGEPLDVIKYIYTDACVNGTKTIPLSDIKNGYYDLIFCPDDSYICESRTPLTIN